MPYGKGSEYEYSPAEIAAIERRRSVGVDSLCHLCGAPLYYLRVPITRGVLAHAQPCRPGNPVALPTPLDAACRPARVVLKETA